MTRDASNHHHVPNGRGRRGHQMVLMGAGLAVCAVALNWAWQRVQALIPDLPGMRFVDAVAIVMAAGFLVFVASLCWRAGDVWHSARERRSSDDG